MIRKTDFGVGHTPANDCVALDVSFNLSSVYSFQLGETVLSKTHRIIIIAWDDIYKAICIVTDKYIIITTIKIKKRVEWSDFAKVLSMLILRSKIRPYSERFKVCRVKSLDLIQQIV